MERVEALLEQAAWVRALARKLVRDEALAEDLVQETWLAALERAPAEEGRLRPWLARVLINFARLARRGRAHRVERESLVAHPERTPPASETAERLEAHRLLVDALQALAEPYRTTVTLRWLDGLSAAEIARRQGVPAGTVRWRLKRGMDELRERLGRRSGESGESFAIALLPLLRRPSLGEIAAGIPTGGASALLQMGVAMSTVSKFALAVAVALTASVGVWVAVDRAHEGAEPTSDRIATQDEPALEAPSVVETERELAPLEHDGRRESAPQESAKPAAGSAAQAAQTRLELRFLDARDRPVQGVQLTLSEFALAIPPTSGQDGRIAVGLDPPRDAYTTEIEAIRAGFATYFDEVTLDRGLTTYVGDVHLEPGGSVAGTVLDGHGAPVGNARVLVTSPEMAGDLEVARVRGPWPGERQPEVRTRSDGSFRVDGVRAGIARVWAAGEETRWSFSEPIDVPVGAVESGVELRLTPLDREDHISGVVLSPQGEPVSGASVRYQGRGQGTWSGSFQTQPDGRFRHRVPVRGPHDFQAHDREGRWPDASALGVLPGTHDLILQFPRPRWIELGVRDRGAGTVDEYSAAILSADRSRTLRAGKVEAHPEGRARVLLPDEPFAIEVRARGRGIALLGPWSPDAAPVSASCTLERIPGIRGRVTRAGEPAPGVRVILYEMANERTNIVRNGFPTRLHPEPEDDVRTDGQGYFELDANRPGSSDNTRFFQRELGSAGTFAVIAEAPGCALAEVGPLEIDPAIGIDGIEIALARGGALEGRVLVAEGRDPAGIIVAADRADGWPHTQRVGPDGQFRFEGLTPGRWNVTRAEAEVPRQGGSTSWVTGDDVQAESPWNCTVTDGETTRFDLDLRDDRPCVLVAQVSVNAMPATGWTAKLWPKKNSTQDLPGGAVDPQGSLRLEARDPGKWRLVLEPPPETQAEASFEVEVELRRGENPLSVDLQTGWVRGRSEDRSDDVRIGFQAAGTTSTPFHTLTRLDANGRFELPFVPVGHGQVVRMRVMPEGGTAGPFASVPISVPAGGGVEVTVP